MEKKKALTTAAAFCHSSSSWNESNKVFDLKSKEQLQDRAAGRGNNQKMLKENNTKEGGAYHRDLKVSYLISKRSGAFHIQQRCLKSSSMQWVWCKRALQALHCEAHFDCAPSRLPPSMRRQKREQQQVNYEINTDYRNSNSKGLNKQK